MSVQLDGDIIMKCIGDDLDSKDSSDSNPKLDTSTSSAIEQEIEQRDIADNSKDILIRLSFAHRIKAITGLFKSKKIKNAKDHATADAIYNI